MERQAFSVVMAHWRRRPPVNRVRIPIEGDTESYPALQEVNPPPEVNPLKDKYKPENSRDNKSD